MIGYAFCGSFCTLPASLAALRRLISGGAQVQPILSETVAATDTRFYMASDFRREVEELCGRPVICSITEARVISNDETMTYSYYFDHVKPKPQTEGKKGYVCKICGYVHEGELPEDFVCPLCLHGASDFEPIN